MSRGMLRHVVEQAGKPVAKRAAHLVDLVRVSIEGVAHHQEETCRLKALHLAGYRFSRWLAKDDLIHFAEDHASRWKHALLPIDRFDSDQSQ